VRIEEYVGDKLMVERLANEIHVVETEKRSIESQGIEGLKIEGSIEGNKTGVPRNDRTRGEMTNVEMMSASETEIELEAGMVWAERILGKENLEIQCLQKW